MNFVDFFIAAFAISAGIRGFYIGLVRQAGSTAGFIGGLFLGSALCRHFLQPTPRNNVTSILIVISVSLVLSTAGEYAGTKLKARLNRPIDSVDGGLGSVMSIVTLLFGVWLLAAMVSLSASPSLQSAVNNSKIIRSLNRLLPPAPQLLGTLNRLIDPNGFPQVFTGLEPSPKQIQLPDLGTLQPAVKADQASVVKVEGAGCGGIVEGSGFVVSGDRVVTNAHVVAGVNHPSIVDNNGFHTGKLVWFDPDLDLAVLQVNNLAGKPLRLNTDNQSHGTPAAVLGYPGGGRFNAQAAGVMDEFVAIGRNIYGQNITSRQIYTVQAKVIPGNSGGPLVGSDGRVIGVVFATSTTYNNVGYALTAGQVSGEISQALHASTQVSSGSCSQD